MTTTILEAWREDSARGVARYRAAAEASGVKPPDTDLLTWGSVMGATDDYAAMLSELIAHRLLAGPALGNELGESIVPVVSAQGWRSGGDPVDARHIVMSIHRPLYFWRLFGLLEEVRPPWIDGHPSGPNITSLSGLHRRLYQEHITRIEHIPDSPSTAARATRSRSRIGSQASGRRSQVDMGAPPRFVVG